MGRTDRHCGYGFSPFVELAFPHLFSPLSPIPLFSATIGMPYAYTTARRIWASERSIGALRRRATHRCVVFPRKYQLNSVQPHSPV